MKGYYQYSMMNRLLLFSMQDQHKLKGKCRFTKYQFEVHVKPTWVGLCHCLDCQKGCGGPYLYIYYFDGAPVKLTKGDESELIVSQSGAYFNKRSSCGSPVYSEKIVDGKIQAQDVFHGGLVNMGNEALLCQPEYRPRDHIWYAEFLTLMTVLQSGMDSLNLRSKNLLREQQLKQTQ